MAQGKEIFYMQVSSPARRGFLGIRVFEVGLSGPITLTEPRRLLSSPSHQTAEDSAPSVLSIIPKARREVSGNSIPAEASSARVRGWSC